MTEIEPLTTYLELRESAEDGSEGAGLSHSAEGLVLLHVLEVAAHGEPRATVTFVHGAGDHGGRYVELAESLAREDFAVALPDLRGHGRSEGQRGHSWGWREIVRDLQSVQDHLAYRLPQAPKFLVGQGLGAIHALTYAVEKPRSLAGLVLVGPWWEPRFELPAKPSGLSKLFKKVGPTSVGRVAVGADALFSTAEQVDAWKQDEHTHDEITLRAGEEAALAARTYAGRIAEAGCPVLILHGGADRVADPSGSKKLAGDGVDVRVLDGCGHDVFHEPAGEEARGLLVDWLVSRL